MKIKQFVIIKFMLIASVLLPGIKLPGLFVVRIEEILVFALLPTLLLSRLGKRLTWIDFCFILVGLSMFISMVWSTLILGVLISPRDLLEFVKIIKAWALLRLVLYPWSDTELFSLAKTLLVSVSVAAFIGIIEWQNWLGLREFLQDIYYIGNAILTVRMIGTVGNPNYYGLLMVMGLGLAVNMWNYDRRRMRNWVNVLAIGLCGIALFGTASRSAVLAIALVICVSLLMRLPRLRYKAAWNALIRMRWQVLVITMLAISAALWTWNQFKIMDTLTTSAELTSYRENPVHRALYRLTGSDIERALNIRMEKMWQPNFPLIMKSPVFGWGAAKEEQKTVTDNGYILTLRRYGFIGLLCFLLLYGQVSRILFKGVRTNPAYSIRYRLAMTVLAILAGYIGANFFIEVFYQLQLLSWLWLFIGIAVSPVFYPFHSMLPGSAPSRKAIGRSTIAKGLS